MVVVDTSVWAHHIARDIDLLTTLLETGDVFAHPLVIGELAMSNLQQREQWLRDLQKLPQAIVATDQETLRLVNQHRLYGQGIGYIDAHLLASARLSANASLWTFDQRLEAAAIQLRVAFRT